MLLITGAVSGQSIWPYPIPSYQVSVIGLARFCESGININAKAPAAKRDGIVKVYTRNPEITDCRAKVWWYSLDGLDILGPYAVLCGETLTVEIDERAWGVLIETGSETLVDVWIEGE